MIGSPLPCLKAASAPCSALAPCSSARMAERRRLPDSPRSGEPLSMSWTVYGVPRVAAHMPSDQSRTHRTRIARSETVNQPRA